MGSPASHDDAQTWKRCNTCKKPLPFGGLYYVCSVSTCTRRRTGFRFCSVECWEAHLPMMRHREAWAVEETAPTREQWEAQGGDEGDDGKASASAPKPAASGGVSAPKPSPVSVSAAASAPRPAPVSAAASVPKPAPVSAPTSASASAPDGVRRRIKVGSAPTPAPVESRDASDDVLVVVSRFKTFVRERFGMNTSDAVMSLLSDHLRGICFRAAENARADGRKTMMDRDFEFLRRR